MNWETLILEALETVEDGASCGSFYFLYLLCLHEKNLLICEK